MNEEKQFSKGSEFYSQQYNLTLAYLRIALPVILSAIVVFFSDYELPYLVPLSLYLLLSLLALKNGSKNAWPCVTGNTFFLVDVILVFWASYATGLQTSALLSLMGVLVVIYTLHRGWRVGLVMVVVLCTGYGTLIILETREVIPVAPLILRNSPMYAMPGGRLAGWMLTATSVGVSYYFTAKLVRLLREKQKLAFSTLRKGNEAIRKEMHMEQQLLTSQRLEGLGRLAGGVAHEFNNLLTVMLGYGRLALDGMDENSDDALDMQEVITAARRGQRLVEQLLFYSRNPQSEPEIISPLELVQNALPMLNKFLKYNVKLEKSFTALHGVIKVDRLLMEQVLVNLVNNSVYAMKEGGTLTLAVYPVDINQSSGLDLNDDDHDQKNSHVCIEVRDEGIGMDEDERFAALEAFYTTKEEEGTGLGLFMVREAVEQHGGIFKMDSAKGKGTTAKIILPLKAERKKAITGDIKKPVQAGKEKILLVEDEEMVREFALRALSRAGYSIVVAKDAESAKREFTETEGFSMLLTDVVLPGQSGYELAQEIWKKNPSFKVLLMSGYSAQTMNRLGIDVSDINLLKKPFTLRSLLERVRKTLDGLDG